MAGPLFLADDLSGAAETAAALGIDLAASVHLWPAALAQDAEAPLVWDLDSRHLCPAKAGERVRQALAARPAAAPVFKKIDSLLRGNVRAEVTPLASATDLVVFTPALPQQGRTVIDGVLLERGVPLRQTRLWALESMDPPDRVADVLGASPVTHIPLATVRGPGLAEALREARGTVAVLDAATQTDLDLIVAAALEAAPGVRFAGSSDLARALGPHLSRPGVAPAAEAPPAGTALMVLGTGADVATAQADRLLDEVDAARHPLAPSVLAALDEAGAVELAQTLAAELATRSVVAQISGPDRSDLSGAAIITGLARLVAAVVDSAPSWPVRLMLTGGQTARAVLDALGCHRLSLLAEIHPGAVLTTTEQGWLIATRPGSHGGPDSLTQIHHALTTPRTHDEEKS